jgi:hypothetical protein
MSTTALAVELLVIGYQALIWLGLAACLSPLCNDTLLQTMKDWKELTVVASVVAAYTSGAIMNGVASRIMSTIEGRTIYKRRPEKPSEMRAAILIENPEAFKHVMKNFDVPRVLRSTIFNIFLIGLFSFAHSFSINAAGSQLFLIAILSVLGTAVAAWAWYETADNYFVHLSRTYDALKGAKGRVKAGTREV